MASPFELKTNKPSIFDLKYVPILGIFLLFAVVGIVTVLLSRAAPTFSPGTLTTSPAHVGQSYSSTLSIGQTATWAVSSGQLPPGLTLSATGQISGTPSQADAFSFVVTATPKVATKSGTTNGSPVTKTYSLLVYPSTTTGYETRQDQIIQAHIDKPFPARSGCMTTVGNLYYYTANLWKNQNLAAANTDLSQLAYTQLMNNYTGSSNYPTCNNKGAADSNSLWIAMLVRAYNLYNPQSSYFPNRLTQSTSDHLVGEMWKFAKLYSASSNTDASDLFNFTGSENLDVQRDGFFFLAAQAFKNNPNFANLTYSDGTTVSAQYTKWRNFWSSKLDGMAKKGMFVEVGSPTYTGYSLSPILNIYNFAEDPVIRKKAEMVLDLFFADYAQTEQNLVWSTSKTRAYADEVFEGGHDSVLQFANLLFGTQSGAGQHALYMATSGYYPPTIVHQMVNNAGGRGTYEYISRRPGAGSSISLTNSVLHYNYETPDYSMGAALLKRGQTYNSASSDSRWQGVQFPTAPDARVYPQVGTGRPKDSFYTVQKNGAAVLYRNPSLSDPTMIYFGASLDQLDEDASGWIFVREGNAYLAVRPQSGGYTWLTTGKNKATNEANRFIKLTTPGVPIIMEAAPASRYTNNFASFKTDILNNARTFNSNVMSYSSTAANGPVTLAINLGTTDVPTVNGTAITYLPANVFNSPYMSSVFDSGLVNLSYGSFRATYDFTNTNTPVKTLSP